MSVEFEIREANVRDASGVKAVRPVEHVRIDVHGDGKQVVHRVATDEDRRLHRDAYWEFNPAAKAKETTIAPDAEEVPADTVVDRKPGFSSRKK